MEASGDPALQGDRLPQPYRMIWKVLDEYILDPAWLEITRLHPELLQDEQGEAFATPHNQALANICTPSAVTEQACASTAVIEKEGLCFMTTDNDAFVVVEPADGKIVQSILLEEPEPEKTAEELAAEAEAAAAAAKGKKGKAAASEEAPPKAEKVTNMWVTSVSSCVTPERFLTFAVASIVTVPEEQEVESDDPKKKGKPELVTVAAAKLRTLVVQARLGPKEGFKASLIQLKVVGQTMVSISDTSLGAVGKVDVSPDARLLCIGTGGSLHLLRLPALSETTRTGAGLVEKVDEDLAEGNNEEDDGPAPIKPQDAPELPVLLTLSGEFFGGKAVKQATLFPLEPRKAIPSKPSNNASATAGADDASAATAGAAGDSGRFYDTGIAVVFADVPEWCVLGLRGLDASGAPIGATEEAPQGNVTSTVLFKWKLSAPPSAVAFDSDRSTVALGLLDGSLCLWNLASRGLASLLGRHETAVVSLSFSHGTSIGGSQAQHFILSGAEDGSLCFFSILLPRGRGVSSTALPAANFAPSDGDAACVTTAFQSFRLDVNAGVYIVDIRPIGEYSWAAVQCSDGMCLVYDVQSGKLLGRLALYSGMTSRQVEWKVSNFKDCVTVKRPTPPLEDDLGYPVEAEAASEETKGEEEEGGKERTFPDPNAFARMPPAKRAAKYAVSTTFDWSAPIEANSVATTSSQGYHCMYWRNGMPVLALFRVEDLFMNFYPQLAALLQSKSAYNIDIKAFFKRLTPAERTDPVAAAHRVHEIYDVYGDGSISTNQGRRTGTGARSRRGSASNEVSAENASLGSAGTAGGSINGGGMRSRTGGTGTIRRGSSAGGSRNQSGQHFTKQNLDALQANLDVSPAETDARIIVCSHERLSIPTDVVKKSAQSSSMDRTIRKNRLMNRLGAISNNF